MERSKDKVSMIEMKYKVGSEGYFKVKRVGKVNGKKGKWKLTVLLQVSITIGFILIRLIFSKIL